MKDHLPFSEKDIFVNVGSLTPPLNIGTIRASRSSCAVAGEPPTLPVSALSGVMQGLRCLGRWLLNASSPFS